jgi:acetyl-CoA carboxylase biotin carboxyl carrier protein
MSAWLLCLLAERRVQPFLLSSLQRWRLHGNMDGRDHRYETGKHAQEEDTVESISIKQLQRLIHLLDTSDVAEIEVKRIEEGTRLVLRKAKAAEGTQVPPLEDAALPDAEEKPSDTKHIVAAPLVGIFHTWSRPKGAALVAVGDQVKVGQPVGTIQSLNVINEVESLVAGRVTEIAVQDGQPVEYGQPLMTIDTVEEA